MTGTPARDALEAFHATVDWDGWKARHIYEQAIAHAIANPDLVVAALIESGWRPTAAQLRAMGGTSYEAWWVEDYYSARSDAPGASPWWRFPEGVDGDL